MLDWYSYSVVVLMHALAIQEYNVKHGSSLKIRVGVNSGPVVGGVMGSKKLTFDIWGDAGRK